MTTKNRSLSETLLKQQFLHCEIENKIAIVTVNRPPVNPLNSQMFKEINEVMEALEAHAEVHAVIITGAGDKAFVAGADLNEMMQLDTVGVMNLTKISRIAFSKIESLSKPVIAAINGLTLGGGFELALACDLRIASEKARFAFPEIGLGIIPGGGGTQRLQRIVGQGVAKELLYFGDMFDAEKALQLQIVNKVIPHDTLLPAAKEWAQKLAEKPAVALRIMKLAVNSGANVDLESGLVIEASCFGNVFGTEDRKEGMAAFVEKRKPNYVGR